MSFSSDTKAELCREPLSRRCCAVAEVYGTLLFCNMFTADEIRIVTSSAELAERLPRLFRKAFGFGLDSVPAADVKGKQTLTLTSREHIRRVYGTYGYEAKGILAHHINLGVLESDCCKAAFLRGAFLAGGSITDPAKSYHLELVTDHYNVSRETLSILLELGFLPKDASRGGNYVIYFKQSETIEDFFTLLGAPVSAMGIMSAKVEKDMRNAVNRRVNCDSANADKIVLAAEEQLEAIRRIERTAGLDALPEKLREAALLRIANPEASLTDLAALAIPPVSKSCISHRLRKLTEHRR
ncbi:MAG: DNA-binding protein WhiA [Oscillospiraceae bacterium]|jgi:DNA-binding protein WhiA|nr:DNA-binding protein WhiA [Oscillospiraceae bacterium]